MCLNQLTACDVTLLGAFSKLRKATISFTSVCPCVCNKSAPTRRVSMKFYISAFSSLKICPENSSFIKTWKPNSVLYTKTYVQLQNHVAEFFSECEIFQTEIAEKIKTRILCSVTFSPKKSCPLRDNVEKHGSQRGRRRYGTCTLLAG
jgi:hypothetical protein